MKPSFWIRITTGLCVVVVLLISSIGQRAFDIDWYTGFYQEIHLARTLDVSSQDLDKAISILVEYVDGARDSLDGTMLRDGKTVEIYNQKEKDHMVDVRALWLKAKDVADKLLLLFIVLCLDLIGNRNSRQIYLGILQAYGLFILILAGLGVWMMVDFNSFWTMFHHVFFSNNLWLLDPATDFMIRICPESMFFALIVQILKTFGLFSALVLILCLLALRTGSREKAIKT